MPTAPRFIPDRLTPVSSKEMLAAFTRAAPELHRASLLTLLAQWALETGSGRSMHLFNAGNIKGKPGGGDGRSWTFFRCNEIINGKEVWFDPPHPACCFRAYDTLDEGVADYLATMRKRFASAWPAVEAGDPARFAHLLKVARYYTASEAGYTSALVALFKRLDDETFDVGGALAELGFCAGDVRAFQAAHGLVVDGIAGPKTKAALRAALAATRT